jgi:hypothetical protein
LASPFSALSHPKRRSTIKSPSRQGLSAVLSKAWPYCEVYEIIKHSTLNPNPSNVNSDPERARTRPVAGLMLLGTNRRHSEARFRLARQDQRGVLAAEAERVRHDSSGACVARLVGIQIVRQRASPAVSFAQLSALPEPNDVTTLHAGDDHDRSAGFIAYGVASACM